MTANRRITPAAEWLLDNFYLIEEQIRTARRHLPKGYSRELPRLANGPSAGLPRVYDLAFEAISHGDGRVDAEGLSPLRGGLPDGDAAGSSASCGPFPIMLRLALIENLRRVGARIAAGTMDRNRAGIWADQMLEVAEHDPKSLILVIADMARSNPPMVSAFVAELARRLQGQSAALALPLTWIEQRLAESGLTIEQLVQAETQEQAADQVSISNTHRQPALPGRDGLARVRRDDERRRAEAARGSGRTSTAGWTSRPATATATSSRRSRKSSPLSESEVARKAIQLAHEGAAGAAGKDGDDDRAAHVGFYLIDKGRSRLEQAARRAASPRRGPAQGRAARPAAAVPRRDRGDHGRPHRGPARRRRTRDGAAEAAAAGAGRRSCCWPPASSASDMVNWLATLLVTPRPLPRMDFSAGHAAAVADAGGRPDDADQRARTSRAWSRRSRSASSPTATTTCTSAC